MSKVTTIVDQNHSQTTLHIIDTDEDGQLSLDKRGRVKDKVYCDDGNGSYDYRKDRRIHKQDIAALFEKTGLAPAPLKALSLDTLSVIYATRNTLLPKITTTPDDTIGQFSHLIDILDSTPFTATQREYFLAPIREHVRLTIKTLLAYDPLPLNNLEALRKLSHYALPEGMEFFRNELQLHPKIIAEHRETVKKYLSVLPDLESKDLPFYLTDLEQSLIFGLYEDNEAAKIRTEANAMAFGCVLNYLSKITYKTTYNDNEFLNLIALADKYGAASGLSRSTVTERVHEVMLTRIKSCLSQLHNELFGGNIIEYKEYKVFKSSYVSTGQLAQYLKNNVSAYVKDRSPDLNGVADKLFEDGMRALFLDYIAAVENGPSSEAPRLHWGESSTFIAKNLETASQFLDTAQCDAFKKAAITLATRDFAAEFAEKVESDFAKPERDAVESYDELSEWLDTDFVVANFTQKQIAGFKARLEAAYAHKLAADRPKYLKEFETDLAAIESKVSDIIESWNSGNTYWEYVEYALKKIDVQTKASYYERRLGKKYADRLSNGVAAGYAAIFNAEYAKYKRHVDFDPNWGKTKNAEDIRDRLYQLYQKADKSKVKAKNLALICGSVMRKK